MRLSPKQALANNVRHFLLGALEVGT